MTAMENLPEVVSPQEWLAARKQLVVKEKELTRARDQLNADRRRLPMVRIDKLFLFAQGAALGMCNGVPAQNTDARIAETQWEYLRLAEAHPKVAGIFLSACGSRARA